MKKKIAIVIVALATIMIFTVCKNLITKYHESKNLIINDIDFKNFKDGVYIGVYDEGLNSWRKNEVKVTILDGTVTNIELLTSAENRPKEFNDEIYGRVLKNQSLQVDVISGATLTSKAYLKAIENALIETEKHN
ncbi:MAG TPA: FMN-binding protein [Bacteroidales bacterium]|nr:FMN-binding protein [Bacteroidales bacterium]